MTTWVYDFCNLYLPAREEYVNKEYGIKIKPLKFAEEFEDKRREPGSKFRKGYWKTSKVHIEGEKEEADQMAEYLTFILSFAQSRDVVWFTSYPYHKGYSNRRKQSSYTYSIDNTNLRLIKGTVQKGSLFTESLGGFLDVALEKVMSANDEEASNIVSSLALYLHSEENTLWSLKFLMLWIVLESNANRNYDIYKQKVGPLFTDDEIEWLKDILLRNGSSRLTSKQKDFLDHRLSQNYLYEHSSVVKIKIYLEHLDIGFDIDEIEEIVNEARNIRAPVVHRNNDEKLMNQHRIVVSLRKIVIYVLLRLLGIDRKLQDRLVTPTIMGPSIQ